MSLPPIPTEEEPHTGPVPAPDSNRLVDIGGVKVPAWLALVATILGGTAGAGGSAGFDLLGVKAMRADLVGLRSEVVQLRADRLEDEHARDKELWRCGCDESAVGPMRPPQ